MSMLATAGDGACAVMYIHAFLVPLFDECSWQVQRSNTNHGMSMLGSAGDGGWHSISGLRAILLERSTQLPEVLLLKMEQQGLLQLELKPTPRRPVCRYGAVLAECVLGDITQAV